MDNLLEETIEVLKNNNKTEEDVLWVGTKEEKATWNNFRAIADVNYDSGFGGQEVAEDLIIVGKDWWLERHEYDGSEWWEFKSQPKEPDNSIVLKNVIHGSWSSLKELSNLLE